MNVDPGTKKEIKRIPIVAIRGSVVFPQTDAVLSFGRPKSVSDINTAFREDRVVGIFTQKNPRVSEPGREDLYKVGTIATITQMMSTEGEVHAVIRGQERISLEEIQKTNYIPSQGPKEDHNRIDDNRKGNEADVA